MLPQSARVRIRFSKFKSHPAIRAGSFVAYKRISKILNQWEGVSCQGCVSVKHQRGQTEVVPCF